MPSDDLTREELRTVVRETVRAELRATIRKLAATVIGGVAAWWGLVLAASGIGTDGVQLLVSRGFGVVLFGFAVLLLLQTWGVWPFDDATAT